MISSNLLVYLSLITLVIVVGLVIAGGETLFDYRCYREDVLRRAAAIGVDPLVLGPVAPGDAIAARDVAPTRLQPASHDVGAAARAGREEMPVVPDRLAQRPQMAAYPAQ